jgi:hypothetical protein
LLGSTITFDGGFLESADYAQGLTNDFSLSLSSASTVVFDDFTGEQKFEVDVSVDGNNATTYIPIQLTGTAATTLDIKDTAGNGDVMNVKLFNAPGVTKTYTCLSAPASSITGNFTGIFNKAGWTTYSSSETATSVTVTGK